MRLVRGIEVTDETLSLDVIEQVVKGEGHFLGTRQSLELMNTEFYYPHTADRQSRDNWQANGSLDMRQTARRQAKQLLKTHQPTPLPAAIDASIRDRFNILLPVNPS